MRHMTGSVYGVFDKPVHMWRGTTMAGIVRDEARDDTKRGFVGGYELETLSLGLPFMAAFLDPGAWGRDFTSAMDSYENMAGMWIVGEDMPQETNRVTLDPSPKDKFGMPVASVHFDDHANDVAMRDHAFAQGTGDLRGGGRDRRLPDAALSLDAQSRHQPHGASGRATAWSTRTARRMTSRTCSSRTASQFTTGGAENPTLTIVSLAIRQADYIAEQMGKNTI